MKLSIKLHFPIPYYLPWHGSADLLSTTKANCLLIVREDAEKLSVGQLVDVILLD